MAKNLSPRTACRYLRDLKDPGSHFRTADGKVLKNLVDLACYLKSCDMDTFRYHVSRDHNHFANWVRHSVLDNSLADQMSLVLEKNPMRLIVSKRVNHLVHGATRKVVGREKAGMILEDAELPEEHFTTNDGRALSNIWELHEFLRGADDKVLAYHIPPNGNHFHDWVGDVLMDHELADKLCHAKDKETITKLVGERISQLEAFKAHKQKQPNLSDYVDQIMDGGD